MALDEALLLGRLRDVAPPTLRFFSWQPATISLGYGQALDHRIDVAAAAALGIGLVRRPTGGSAILHEGPELELTYSVAARTGDFEGAGELLETYRWIGAALAAGINRLGAPVEMVPVQPSDPTAMPTFCFARTGSYELEVAGLKVVGSAQRRQGSGFLQHGAVMLGAAPDRLRREFPDAPRVGVGAVILDGDRVLLVKRGQPPSEGKWSIPGGLVHLGERIEDAVRREVQEECGVRVRLLGLCGVIDRVRLAPGNGSGAPREHTHSTVIRNLAGSKAREPA